MTKSTIIMAMICTLGMASCQTQSHQPAPPTTEGEAATVYMTTDISPDEEGEMQLPVKDTKHLQYDIVGSHLQNYDFMINLAHFKGHAMGGFGGVLKNQSIGVASTDPVALDQACLDLVFNHINSEGDDAKPLQERINKKHGTHTVEYAEQIGLGTRKYTIVSIDNKD